MLSLIKKIFVNFIKKSNI